MSNKTNSVHPKAGRPSSYKPEYAELAGTQTLFMPHGKTKNKNFASAKITTNPII
jgi:hypothetical protein